ncbi:MAG: sodium:proton symporter [Pelosinus sp.]|jgi:CPA1 family monovalent cation:H+ antiporter|nr:sodium:proton symporter [Pelosinus sp.]
METFFIVLSLLILIAFSNILNRFIPFVPIPLIQISLGIVLAFLPGIHILLNPELFFVLFIAPLLFNDGKMIPRDELWKLRLPILLLALGLVFVTVLVMGYIINWMIPGIPLAAAFALAAILSPTDAVAVGAMARRIDLPKDLMRLLEGEALMNDASGLVAFKFAIAAMVTGVFSLMQATISFFMIAIGGLLSGVVLSFLFIRLGGFVRRLGMEDVTMHMLIKILTPFIIYLIAEEMGVSGILAVVAGGIVQAIDRDHAEPSMANLQVVSRSTWSVIVFILNGIVFLILGLQIPDVTRVIFSDKTISNMQVMGYITAIFLCLLFLRFAWNYLFWEGKWIFNKEGDINKPPLRSVALVSFSGVRGVVTLAGAFSIPFVLQDGLPFPERSLIIFLAAGVILFSLITASVMLPLLSKKSLVHGEDQEELEQTIRIKIMKTVIQDLKEERNSENKAAVSSLISDYQKIMRTTHLDGNEYKIGFKSRKMESEILMVGINAEREEIQHLLDTRQISQDVAYRFQEQFNVIETSLSDQFVLKSFFPVFVIKRYVAKWFSDCPKRPELDMAKVKTVKIQTAKTAITAIRSQISEENRNASLKVIANYHKIIEKISTNFTHPGKKEQFHGQKKELQFKAIQMERNEVQSMFEEGLISREIANNLRRSINFLEATMLEEDIG